MNNSAEAKAMEPSLDDKNAEALLEERMKEITARKNEEKKDKEIKEKGYIFACDVNGKVYAINREGTEIVEGIEIPDFEIEFVTDDITGLVCAKNQFGDILEVIEIS
jgi:hypothetical protein